MTTARALTLVHDPIGPLLAETPALLRVIERLQVGVPVALPPTARVRAVVAQSAGLARRAIASDVPFLLGAAGAGERWPHPDLDLADRVFVDEASLRQRLLWLLDDPATSGGPLLAGASAEARAWLEAIHEEERRGHERRTADGAAAADLAAALARVRELDRHIASIEGSRAWRFALALRGAAALVRRPGRPAATTEPGGAADGAAPGSARAAAAAAADEFFEVDLVMMGGHAVPDAPEGVRMRVVRVAPGIAGPPPGDAPAVAFLDPDARLAPAGLLAALRAMEDEGYDAVLTAEADARGVDRLVRGPWSLLEARSWALASGLTVMRRELVRRLGGTRPQAGWDAPHDLLLRAPPSTRIGSVGAVGCIREGALGPRRARPDIGRVLKDDLARRGNGAVLERRPRRGGVCRIRRPGASRPLVSVIVPTRDAPDLVEGVHAALAATRWPALDVVLIDNGTRDRRALAALERSPHRVLRADIPFNFSRLVNRGAAAARGSYLVLLNNDVEVDDPHWLEALVDVAAEPGSGPVGALLRYPSGAVQHCGIALRHGVPVHPLSGTPLRKAPFRAVGVPAHRLAVSGACMAICAELFRRLGGLETLLGTSYNDVDLCLRAAALGRPAAFTPFASLIHYESRSRGREASSDVAADWLLFRARWAAMLDQPDPWWPAEPAPARPSA